MKDDKKSYSSTCFLWSTELYISYFGCFLVLRKPTLLICFVLWVLISFLLCNTKN